jgi:hypothetical protein
MTAPTLAGICRADRPVRHPLTARELSDLNADLYADGVPVTVQIVGPQQGPRTVVLWPSLKLTTAQQAHTLRLVTARTDATVRWAGAL